MGSLNELLTDIIDAATNQGLSSFGIRANKSGACVGDMLLKSHQCGDTWSGELLDGTSTIGIYYDGFDVDGVDQAIKALAMYLDGTRELVLVGGNSSYEGTDMNESVITDAQVLYVFPEN
jgi:hypothetical protein